MSAAMRHLISLFVLGSILAGCGGKTCEDLGLPATNEEYFTVELEQSGNAILINWAPDTQADEVLVEDADGGVLWHVQCNEDQDEPCIETGITMFTESLPAGVETVVPEGDPEDDVAYTVFVGQYGVQCSDQVRSGRSVEFTLSSGTP